MDRLAFERALDSFRRADPVGALASLEDCTTVDGRLLRARIQHRTGDWQAAVVELTSLCDAPIASDEVAHAAFLRAACLTQLRDLDQARSLLDAARWRALSSSDRALEAECHYYETLWHFASGSYDRAEHAADEALHCGLIFGTPDESRHVMPLGVTKARAYSALGVIAGAREDYHRQARFFRQAVETFESCGNVDEWAYATILMNLSYSARDLDLADDADRIRRALQRSWAPVLNYSIFEMRRSIAWHDALCGEMAQAFDSFTHALREARSPGLAVLVRTERCQVRGEDVASAGARVELEAIVVMASEIDWESTGEERSGLLALAREFAPFDVAAARRLLETYRRLRTPIAPRHLDSRDRRVVAYERLAEGSVLRHEGRWPEAIRAFFDAFEIWHEVGMRWRAAIAAIELAEMEGSRYFVDYSRAEATRRSRCWFASRAMRLAVG